MPIILGGKKTTWIEFPKVRVAFELRFPTGDERDEWNKDVAACVNPPAKDKDERIKVSNAMFDDVRLKWGEKLTVGWRGVNGVPDADHPEGLPLEFNAENLKLLTADSDHRVYLLEAVSEYFNAPTARQVAVPSFR